MSKCIFCGKEQPDHISNEVKGALFVCRDTGGQNILICPAAWLLAKKKGCVEFGSLSIDNEFVRATSDFLKISPEDCKELYLDVPGEGEAWLVVSVKGGYNWTRVDEDIVFWEGCEAPEVRPLFGNL